MSQPKTDEVLVPVELVERVAEALNTQGAWPQMAKDLRALIPKPKPRLVAVNLDDYANDERLSVYELNHWPDLLTVLDDVIESYWGNLNEQRNRDGMKAAVRAALGDGA
jgi:hypothetical protein